MKLRGVTLTQEQTERLATYALDALMSQLNGHGLSVPGLKMKRSVKRSPGQRRPMTAAERAAVSRRMKAMWKQKRGGKSSDA